jgi:hypothetical protein
MALTEQERELLEGYFRNTLTAEEKIAFEQIKEKDAVQTELAELQRLEQAFAILERKRLKNKFIDIETKLNQTRNLPIYQAVWFKAAVFVLIPAAFLWLYAYANYSDSNLAQSYYVQPVYEVERGNGITHHQYTAAFEAFSNRDFNAVLQIQSNEVDVLVLKAHAYYKLQETENALVLLDKILTQAANDEAEWLKINILLQQGKFKDVKLLAEKMSLNNSHAYQQQAANLLKELKHPLRKLVF